MSRSPKQTDILRCWCGNPVPFDECCGPLLCGDECAATAEQLMRSRYSAYVQGDVDYLLATWHPRARPRALRLDDARRWLGLKVVRVEEGGAADATGVVAFVARYKIGGRGHRLEETSRFERIEGRWLYVDGDVS